MNKPTKEEYESACKDIEKFSDWIKATNSKINRLLDSICSERENIKLYEKKLEELNKVKMLYETYKEVNYGM